VSPTFPHIIFERVIFWILFLFFLFINLDNFYYYLLILFYSLHKLKIINFPPDKFYPNYACNVMLGFVKIINQSSSCVNIATPLLTQWSLLVLFSIGNVTLNT
jgi:hypothetical protein